ncbi:MAG: RNA polymerase sigma factor [Planctomycetota bacterium]
MFPTTLWDVVREAGGRDPAALERFAAQYRAPVLEFVRGRGVRPDDAEDLCQDVFARLLSGDVLAKADPARGSLRSLLCAVTVRVIQDRARRRREPPPLEAEPAAPQPEFDRSWALHLAERALARMREEEPRHFGVLDGHLHGVGQQKNRLSAARGRLASLLRREVALTCRSHRQFLDEMAELTPYLRPAGKNRDTRGDAANKPSEEPT